MIAPLSIAHGRGGALCAAACCVVVVSWLGAAPSPAATHSLEKLRLSYELKLEKIEQSRAAAAAQLREKYSTALGRSKTQAQEAGDLDAVLLIDNEIRAASAGKWPMPALAADAPAAVAKLRSIYVKEYAAIERAWARELDSASRKMEQLLEEQVAELTRAGEIDKAKEANDYAARIASDPDVASARALVENVSPSGGTRAALRLRRHGDNVEVLVRYDSRGKISMSSPVENVRERPVGAERPGDTTAETLGEFVGARGFKADPVVMYHEVFDGEGLGDLLWGQMIPKFRHKEGERRGMAVALAPKATNPHGSINPGLPPLTSKGEFKITCDYFIPKSNQVLVGFYFVHAAGGSIGGKVLDTAGKWTTAELTGESTHQQQSLVIHPRLAEGKKFADAGDEYIVFGELKVEHVRTSAYLVERYDLQGEVVESQPDRMQQEVFVLNGQLKR